MASNIERRRKIRALEAERDKLMTQKKKADDQLKVVRTKLKTERGGK